MKKRILALVLSLALLMSTVPGTLATSAASDSSVSQVEIVNSNPVVCENCGTEGHTSETCEACTECKQTYTHAEDCSLNLLNDGAGDPELCTTCGTKGCTSTHENWCVTCKKDDCGVDHTPVSVVRNCEHCGAELTAETIHTEECPLYEAPVVIGVFANLMAAESVEDMYALMLDFMETDMDGLLALSREEINQLRDRVAELDPERDDIDTQDLLDTLDVLPNGGPSESAYDLIASATSLAEMWKIMSAEENAEGVEALTYNEIQLLIDHAEILFANIFVPSGTDATYRRNICDKLYALPAVVNQAGVYVIGNRDITSNVAFNSDSVTSNASVQWNISSGVTLTINGTIKIPSGSTLTITGPGKILRNTLKPMFNVESGGTLIINGVTIDGNNINCSQAAIFVYGSLNVTNSTIEKCVNTSSASGDTGAGGAIMFGSYSSTASSLIKNSTITNCQARNGSAIMFRAYNNSIVRIENSYITNCVATVSNSNDFGGTIRTQGDANSQLTIYSCSITGNKSTDNGGGVYWNAKGSNCSLTITGTSDNPTKISNNTAVDGGGVFISGSSITIENTEISENKATNGGGIKIEPFDYGTTSGKGASLTLGSGAVISGNTATSTGGGVYMHIKSSSTKSGEKFYITIQDSAVVQGNSAPNGGAIAITQIYGNKKQNGNTGNEMYHAYVNITGGTISGNTASSNGGAIYISREYGTSGANYDLQVNVSGGKIYGNTASGNGGAIYLSDNATNSKAKVTVSGGEATNNTAVNGGAVYISGGNFTMSGGTVSSNSATTNGGAVYVTRGSVTMSGGDMENNTATTNGGAAYVDGGNVTMSGGSIIGNTALNGGGAYIAGTGNFTMISGTLSSNTAVEKTAGAAEAGNEGYGGAVYVAGGNVYVGVKDCTGDGNNHTNEYTGLTHPLVTENEAVFGGAFAVRGTHTTTGDVTNYSSHVYIYCGKMVANESDNDGTGMNIFMDDGQIFHYLGKATIGDDDNHGMVSIGGELTIVHGDNNQFIITITYFSNSIEGDNGVEITWTGTAPENYVLNLPYCPTEWQNIQNNNQLAFVGWAKDRNENQATEIRAKDDYYQIGTPMKIEDIIKDPNTTNGDMYFYAVWAPKVNNIAYVQSLDGSSIVAIDSNSATKPVTTLPENAPKTYEFAMTSAATAIGEPSRPGYTFQGWKMYADNTKISNWDMDATNYTPDELSDLKSQDYLTGNTLSTLQNFGDIVLVAVFSENTADFTYAVVTKNYNDAAGTNAGGAGGTVYLASETDIQVETGTVSGSTATAAPGYEFKGWYTDAACTTKVDSTWVKLNKLTPQKTNEGIYAGATYYALFEELTVIYNYKLIGPTGATGFGSLEPNNGEADALKYSVTVGQVTGSPSATATANYGFKVKGWFTDQAGTEAVNADWVVNTLENGAITQSVLTPDKVNGLYQGGTFYAVIEYHLADLTISKTATGSYIDNKDHQQTFIFEVYQGDKLLTTVALRNGESVTIKDLIIGTTYTVKEVGGWSWRFDAKDAEHTMVPVAEGAENTNRIDFTNTQNKFLWLTDDTFVLNKRKSN